jgi:hypothetical protein
MIVGCEPLLDDDAARLLVLELGSELLKVELSDSELCDTELCDAELWDIELWDVELLSDTDWLALAEKLLVDCPEELYVLDDATDWLGLF